MIVVTYIDKTSGDEDIVKFAKRKGMARTEIAHRGMRRLFGRKWKMRYQLLNVTDEDAKEEDEAPQIE